MEKMRLQCLRSIVVLVYLAVFSSFGASPSNGQAGKGSIAGFVKDSSDAVLKGAQIKVQPSDLSATSDATGRFVVNGLDPGNYTVYFDYVGFSTTSKTVTVVAGQDATVDVKLTVSSVDLQVLVTAERPAGEAEAINIERTADNIVQILPADVIRSLPNANMADALGRLPSVTIERDEGEGKYVQVRGTEPRLLTRVRWRTGTSRSSVLAARTATISK